MNNYQNKEWDILKLPIDEHLEKVYQEFAHENNWKSVKMTGGNTMWVQKPTRRNLFYVYKYIYDNDKLKKKRSFYSIESISKEMKLTPQYVRPLLLILCYMKNPLLKWEAFLSYNHTTKQKQIVQKISRA